MRVLHVQKAAGVSGSERHLITLLPALAERGIDVRMCILTCEHSDRFVYALRSVDVATTEIPAGPDINPVATRQLVRLIRDYRPDIVHTHLIHADMLGITAARLAGTPAVSTMHDVAPFYRRPHFRWPAQRVARLTRRRIAISHHVAGYMFELGLAQPGRLSVIHYGLAAQDWVPRPGDVPAAKVRFGVSAQDFTFGIASRLVRGKGHSVLIDAFRQLKAQLPQVGLKLLIAGEGPLDDELKNQAGDLLAAGSIRFLGFIEDIRAFMHACDAIVFPTGKEFGEGFGLAALEALAAGRPVIASSIGPLPEVIDHSSGLLTEPDSVISLVDALHTLCASPGLVARLSAGAAARAQNSFALDTMANKTIIAYQKALNDR